MEKESDKKVTKHKFYFESSLYSGFGIDELEENFFSGDVDGYSNDLKDNTTYSINFNWINTWDKWEDMQHKKIGFGEVTLTCKRKENGFLRFFIFRDTTNSGVLMKVGQYPSVADLEFQKMQEKYEKVLEKKYLIEFKRAVGLFAHGVGVGSFVYLRRIFEDLIQKAFDNNQVKLGIEEKDFKSKHIDEKIKILKDFLPSQLFEMKIIYGILSKGVHELEDDFCLGIFPTVKLAVELILDQKIEEEKKRVKDEAVKKQLAMINHVIKENGK